MDIRAPSFPSLRNRTKTTSRGLSSLNATYVDN